MRSVADRNVVTWRLLVYLFKKEAQSGNKYTPETNKKCPEKKASNNNCTRKEYSIPFKSDAL
jgi:hypothetical protein